jgi:hypothetical protein
MMKEMNKVNIISICGDICSECPRYIATLSEDMASLEYLAALWHRLGFRDRVLPPEEMKCTGCNKKKDCNHGINTCEHLGIKNNCGECDHFPCDKIKIVFEKTRETERLCKTKCTPGEYTEFDHAFFMKQQILGKINRDLIKGS